MTPGAAELDVTVRHLLRNLGDVEALRSNRLTARFFSAAPTAEGDALVLARIRRRVEALADRLESEAMWYPHRADSLRRQRSILEACDLAGRPHKAVAAELGLERRQFYRERERLRRRVAQWLVSLDDASPATCVDRLSTELAYLRALRTVGLHDRLVAAGRRLLNDAVGERRTDIANLMVEALSECGEFAAAEALCAEENVWGRAYLDAMQGRYAAAADGFMTIAEHWARYPSPSDGTGDETQARAALEYAQCAHMMGDYRGARRGWQLAGDLLASEWLTPSTRLQTVWQLAAASMMTRRGIDEAAAVFDQVLGDALRQDCLREAADILIARANVRRQRKAFDAAHDDARNALMIAREVFGANAGAWRALNVASIELAAGRLHEAIELVHEAARAKGAHPMRDGFGEWIESSALLELGNVDGAVAVSTRAIDDFRAADNNRHLGASLRVYAEAAARASLKREAADAIEEAVELLARYGLPGARANALRSRVAILGA